MPELLSLLERKNLGTKNDGDFQMRVKGGASRSHLVSHSVGQTSRRQPPPAAASRRHRTLFLFSPSSSIPPPYPMSVRIYRWQFRLMPKVFFF